MAYAPVFRVGKTDYVFFCVFLAVLVTLLNLSGFYL